MLVRKSLKTVQFHVSKGCDMTQGAKSHISQIYAQTDFSPSTLAFSYQ